MIELIKDQFVGKIMIEFVGLRAKTNIYVWMTVVKIKNQKA